jgi:protein-L-isoaspartate(D-aspartate) O-methyltransferase
MPLRILATAAVFFMMAAACGRAERAFEPATAQQTAAAAELRKTMVDSQLRSRGITHAGVLRAMLEVPREEFVPEEFRERAYEDSPLPIGLVQTISQPNIVAMMSELVDPQPADRILEVGTGSGYQAAVIARLVAEVYTIEIIPEHAAAAAQRLKRLGFNNVEVRAGNGYLGWPEKAPFDGILVTAGATEIPKPLIDQLRPGARMVIPVGSSSEDQVLKVIEKHPSGTHTERDVIPVRFVPLRKQ